MWSHFNPFHANKTRRVELNVDLLESVLVLGAVIEARDAYTGGHTWRVAQYSRLLAQQTGLSPQEVFLAGLGGFVHDLGKVAIPDQILNKREPLSEVEFRLLKTHPMTGNTLLAAHPLGPLVLDAVTHHHERYDGQGYPGGLNAEQLSVYPRIVAVADCFDAMTSSRPYRKGVPKDEVLATLAKERGRQLDGAMVDSFLELAVSGRLEGILGHSDEGRPLAHCPVDGPIIALPRSKREGDTIYCHACKGLYRLHIAADTFELEPLMRQRFDLLPETDLGQINEIARNAPRQVKISGH